VKKRVTEQTKNNNFFLLVFSMQRIRLRQYQESVIQRALEALENGQGVIINSPTGTGKTLMGLEIGRRYSEKHGFRHFDVFVRTRSQYTPWEDNARKLNLKFTGLMAKSLFCKYISREYYEICEICGISKKDVSQDSDHQHKWKRVYSTASCSNCEIPGIEECNEINDFGECISSGISEKYVERLQKEGILKFAIETKKKGVCAYPDMLKIPADFRLFSYIYYFLKIVVPKGELLIFDEAHNLELQELMRQTVSVYDFMSLSTSKKEKEILELAFKRFIETESLDAKVRDIRGNEVTIEELLLSFEDEGEKVLKKCKFVLSADDSFYKEKTDKYYRVIARDPSVLLSRLNTERYVLMSGTMPSEKYLKDVWGLEKFEYIDVWRDYYDEIKDFYHMNISVVDVDLTYKNRNGNTYKEIAEFIKTNLRKDGVNLVSTTSKQMMLDLALFLHADFIEKDGKIDFEELQNLPDGAVILAYEGGRLTEGVEITKDGKSRIKAVFVVGFPYPEYKDKYLNSVIDYLAEKKGLNDKAKEAFRWFVMKEKAIIKVRQTMGRAIRGPQDEADIWLIDKRFTYRDIAEKLGIEVS
jgi:Type III restriction enzyme, res subunit.